MSETKTTPAQQSQPPRPFVDLYQDSGEIVLMDKNVGPVIAYHGRDLDLRRLTTEQAQMLANDPKFRSVAYKEVAEAVLAKKAKDKEAAIAQAKKAASL